MKLFWCCIALFAINGSVAFSSDMKFGFNLPGFGGNSLNASYFMTMMESQKRLSEQSEQESTLDDFNEALERRILSTLSSEIVNQIFGPDAADQDSFSVGDLNVSYNTNVNGEVVISITDGITTTQVTVPDVSS